ncbi:unnamed protein product, partial [Prorocentrum cordatum]
DLGGPRRVNNLSAVVIAPWLDAKAYADYRMPRPFLTQQQSEELLQAWFQDPTDRLYNVLENKAARQLFQWFLDPAWDRVGQYRPGGARRHATDRYCSLHATLPDHVEWTGATAGPDQAPLGPAKENLGLDEGVLGKRMLVKSVDRMTTYGGVSYDDLEKHVKDNPSFDYVQHRAHRLAWSGGSRPYVTIQGRRASLRLHYEVEFADSLVHYEWLQRSDYVSPDRGQRALEGFPEFDLDPTPLYKVPMANFNLRGQ